MKKRTFIRIMAVTALSCSMFSGSLMASEKVETLLIHHFLGPKSPAHTKLLVPLAEKIEKLSHGKIKVEIFPSMSMGGKPNELYKQARDGSADIVWTVAGYTPGVFPKTEVYELPTVHRGSSLATNLAIKENFDLIKDDFKDVKPLLVHVHAGNAFHMVEKKVTSTADLKGMKLRTPSRTGAWIIEALGAEPVGMPLPAFPQALSKKAIDGGMIPFEVFPPFKFHQLTQYSTVGPDDERFGTSVFLLLMNKDRFNSLPKDLQKVIEDATNIDLVKEAGVTWMNVEKPGMKMQRESKDGDIIELSQESMDEFNKVGETVVQRWIKEANDKGIDGQKLVDSARASIAKYTK